MEYINNILAINSIIKFNKIEEITIIHTDTLKEFNFAFDKSTNILDVKNEQMFVERIGQIKVKKIIIKDWTFKNLSSLEGMFAYSKFEEIEFNNVIFNKVNNIQRMFYYCSNLKKIIMPVFNTSVDKSDSLFEKCVHLETIIFKNIEFAHMYSNLFYHCSNLKKIDLTKAEFKVGILDFELGLNANIFRNTNENVEIFCSKKIQNFIEIIWDESN